MDYRPLPVGVDNFEKLMTNGYYFVDKSLLIKDLLDKKGDVSLFTRPRRFGKTLNLSMLQYFFEDAGSQSEARWEQEELFQNLKIMQAGEKYLSHMGKYPVIHLTLKSAKQPEWRLAFHMLRRELAREFRRHDFVLGRDGLTEREKERFLRLRDESASYEEYLDALRFLSDCLFRVCCRKTVILLDEYDVPLENAFFEGFYEEMLTFIRSLFESALKTSGSLEFAVITGCLRISRESIFTGMNNLDIISVLSRSYGEYFGFTEEEIVRICQDYRLEGKYGTIKEWYDGYVFGNTNVYNPWSVIQCIREMSEDKNAVPSSYWANTSSNRIVRTLIETADETAKKEIEALIDGESIVKPVHEDITYEEIYKSTEYLWNFMFFTGYFRKSREWLDSQDSLFVEMSIPNREVKSIFRMKVMGWFDEKIKAKDRSRLFKALEGADAETVEEEISGLLMETISFYDAYESFYHGFLAGILSGMKGYVVKSNREGGTGRSDLFIRPVTRRKPACVLEFKIAERFQDMERRAGEALRQIEERQYARELENDGYQQVIRYGISFFGKDCAVCVEKSNCSQ